MKIGVFAKKFNISISTIRHYMDLGLLLPSKKGGQYTFTDNDCAEMECILELKNSGFQLRELQKYISVMRLYDTNDEVLYRKLYDLLVQKYDSMQLEKQQLEHNMSQIKKKSREVDTLCKNEDCSPSVKKKDSTQTPYGIPLEFIPYMGCPLCQSSISLENVIIQGTCISEGSLHCSCGYQALIKDGIIFTGNVTYVDGEPEFSASYYGGDPFLQEYDSMFFECIDKSSIQFLTAMHKAGIWLHEILKTQNQPYSCILFPDIATHFLYRYYNKPYLKDSLLLVTALTEKAMLPMRQHLSSLQSDLKIVYFVNQDGKLPLKNESIDLMVDFYGSANLSFFSKSPYLKLIDRYLKPEAAIAGALDYYAPGAKSLKTIQSLYKHALPDNLKLNTLTRTLSDHNFEIIQSETLCSDFIPGEYFEYHEAGETRSNFTYFAKRNPK